jgi:hypothetical protein
MPLGRNLGWAQSLLGCCYENFFPIMGVELLLLVSRELSIMCQIPSSVGTSAYNRTPFDLRTNLLNSVLGSVLERGEFFLISSISTLDLGPIQPPVQWVC